MPPTDELQAYRQHLLTGMEQVMAELKTASLALSPEKLHTSPPNSQHPAQCTPHYILSRLRFVQQQAFSPRLKQILTSETPELSVFDDETWMQAQYNMDESVEKIISEYESLWRKEIERAKSLSEPAWNRMSHHPSFGSRTFQWWLEYSLAYARKCLAIIRNPSLC